MTDTKNALDAFNSWLKNPLSVGFVYEGYAETIRTALLEVDGLYERGYNDGFGAGKHRIRESEAEITRLQEKLAAFTARNATVNGIYVTPVTWKDGNPVYGERRPATPEDFRGDAVQKLPRCTICGCPPDGGKPLHYVDCTKEPIK